MTHLRKMIAASSARDCQSFGFAEAERRTTERIPKQGSLFFELSFANEFSL